MKRKDNANGSLAKLFFVCILFVASGFWYSCSDDTPLPEIEKEPEETEEPQITHSVNVNDGQSDMPPGGGVITSQYPVFSSGNYVSNMVDKKPETKYVMPHKSFYVTWACKKSTIVNQYSLTSADDSPESDPSAWALYGSNDHKQWNLLDEQKNQLFATRGEVKEFLIENDTEYLYYKLDIRDNRGSSSTQIAEWAMCLYQVKIDQGISNMPPGGGIITPQYPLSSSGHDVSKMVDGNPETKFVTPYSAFYILWTCNERSPVNQYSLTSANDSPESDPTSWTLYGSHNKKVWTLLDEQEGIQFSEREETKVFKIKDDTEYLYYKLDIKSNGGAPSTQIAEWSIAEVFTDIDDLMIYAEGFSNSSLTPMGNHYANRHVTTNEDRAWLLDPLNEPSAPASASHLTLAEFPVTLYPFGKPLPADVNQHAIGDCGGLAALASLAYIYPDFIMSLIVDNGDKTYTVSMFDPQGKPIEVAVTNLFLSGNGRNIDAVSGKNNTATWSTVLEKAIMKYNAIYKVNPDIGGIGSEHTLPLFTGDGNSFAFYPGKLSNKDLARAVKFCLTDGKLIIGGFNRANLPVDGSKTVTAHAYTLMHSKDRNALFAMRNPWGGNPDVDGTADGVLNIPNNYTIPPTIDLRIVNPGIAANFGNGITEPYTPPVMSAQQMQMRVAAHLLSPTPINN